MTDTDLEKRVRMLEDQLARIERDWAHERSSAARERRRGAWMRIATLAVIVAAYIAYFYGLTNMF
ncbi:MAG: hypothetical protein GY711_06940 [bacterium]|nr:hypothetical protein [bacterium]